MSLALTKPCKDCGVVKQLVQFYACAMMRDGYRNTCIECHCEYNRDNQALKMPAKQARDLAYRQRPEVIAKRLAYVMTKRGRAVKKRADKAYRVTHAEQIRAYNTQWKRRWRAENRAALSVQGAST